MGNEKKKGMRGLVGLLCLINVTNPMSMDMYSPAIPIMAGQLGTTDTLVSWSMTVYFMAVAVAMLFYGPISDKMGRKPMLILGGIVFLLGTVLCATAQNGPWLIIGRCVAAAGAGGMYACMTAMTKDAFDDESRARVLSLMQIGMLLGPVIAPVLGAALLKLISWRGIFGLIAIIGAVDLVWSIIIPETLPRDQRSSAGMKAVFGGLARVSKDHWFMKVLWVKCAHSMGYMAFIACSAFIYQNMFGFTAFQYSLVIGILGILMIPAAFVYSAASRKIGITKVTLGMLVASVVAGLVLLLAGHVHWLIITIPIAVFFVYNLGCQPELANALLASRDSDIGSASSMMNVVMMVCGSIGMALVAIPVSDYIVRNALLIIVPMLIAGIVWISVMRDKASAEAVNWK